MAAASNAVDPAARLLRTEWVLFADASGRATAKLSVDQRQTLTVRFDDSGKVHVTSLDAQTASGSVVVTVDADDFMAEATGAPKGTSGQYKAAPDAAPLTWQQPDAAHSVDAQTAQSIMQSLPYAPVTAAPDAAGAVAVNWRVAAEGDNWAAERFHLLLTLTPAGADGKSVAGAGSWTFRSRDPIKPDASANANAGATAPPAAAAASAPAAGATPAPAAAGAAAAAASGGAAEQKPSGCCVIA